MIKPKFITFEGIDGAGKSSHIEWFGESLRARGVRVLITREPGGTRLGEIWREQMLREQMTAESQTLLMFASRSEHLAQLIRPALMRSDWVLCDRFTDATYAYQGGGYGVATDTIDMLAQWLHSDCVPDMTILFDVPLDVSRQRLMRNGRSLDRFENEEKDFMQRVRDAYLGLAARDPQRYRLVDGSQTRDTIRNTLCDFLDELLPQ
ncbi:MAG: dTMP kinase [Burkholderiales bacterium]|jgi:dTMP kinase|nr:dTMP kinase [Burkholderiales bacterium]